MPSWFWLKNSWGKQESYATFLSRPKAFLLQGCVEVRNDFLVWEVTYLLAFWDVLLLKQFETLFYTIVWLKINNKWHGQCSKFFCYIVIIIYDACQGRYFVMWWHEVAQWQQLAEQLLLYSFCLQIWISEPFIVWRNVHVFRSFKSCLNHFNHI